MKTPPTLARRRFTLGLLPILIAGFAGLTAAQAADVTVSISGDDMMKFNKSSFTVKAGQKVQLVLTHSGKLPKLAMGHNVVILQSGVDVTAFAADALQHVKNDYIPKGRKRDIVAHTKMIGGGETTSITFTAPTTPGKYPYICTFPGHAVLMKGVMIVE